MIKKITLSFCGLMTVGMGAVINAAFSEPSSLLPSKIADSVRVLNVDKTTGLAKAPMKEAPVFPPVITEVEGRKQYYEKASSGYFPWGDYVYSYEQEQTPAFLVFGEDNDVYFLDLMEFSYPTYIKGTIEGNKIVVELPQTAFIEEYKWYDDYTTYYYYELYVMKMEGEGSSLNFRPVEEITSYTYTISEDGTITMDDLGEGLALGLEAFTEQEDENQEMVWYKMWAGSADFTQSFTPIDEEVVEITPDMEKIEYRCAINGYNYPVTVSFVDNYMYIQGLADSPYISNLTVKATIDGNTAYIPQNQMVGVYSFENSMIITKVGYVEYGDMWYADDSVRFELTIDNDRKTLTCVDPSSYLVFVFKNDLGYLYDLKDFSIIYQDSYSGTPINPKNPFWEDFFLKDYGYYNFGFDIYPLSTEGTLLNTANLYYRIFIDGELEVFEYDPDGLPYSHYYMLPEATSEIPFSFTNDSDLDIWTETERQVGIYYDGVTTMGVQAVYRYEGEVTYSEIVTLNLDTGEVTMGVESVTDADVISTEYYDLNGRKVVHPERGIFVKKSTLSDGTVKAKKVTF